MSIKLFKNIYSDFELRLWRLPGFKLNVAHAAVATRIPTALVLPRVHRPFQCQHCDCLVAGPGCWEWGTGAPAPSEAEACTFHHVPEFLNRTELHLPTVLTYSTVYFSLVSFPSASFLHAECFLESPPGSITSLESLSLGRPNQGSLLLVAWRRAIVSFPVTLLPSITGG